MTFGDGYQSRLDIELNSGDSNVLYTSTRRQQAFNDGVAEFAALTECYVRLSTGVTVTHDVREYNYSTIADFSRIYTNGLAEYEYESSNGERTLLAGDSFLRRDELWLNRYNPSWRTSTTPVKFPTGHYIRYDGGRVVIGLVERPSVGSSEVVKLRVPYVARPSAMTASTDVPFTDTSGNTRQDLTEYHQAAVHYAAHRLLPLTGDEQGSDRQLQKFLAYVKRYLDNARPRGGQHVTLSRSYYRESMRRGDGDAALDRDPTWRWVP